MQKTQTTRKYSAGFTLIEMLITVALIGILGAIAMPSYTRYVQRSERTNARNTLIQAAQWMERAATSTGTYPAQTAVPASVLQVKGGRYNNATITVNPLAATYTLTVTRKSGTPQANDACGDFRLDQANNRTVVNNSGGTTADDCWSR